MWSRAGSPALGFVGSECRARSGSQQLGIFCWNSRSQRSPCLTPLTFIYFPEPGVLAETLRREGRSQEKGTPRVVLQGSWEVREGVCRGRPQRKMAAPFPLTLWEVTMLGWVARPRVVTEHSLRGERALPCGLVPCAQERALMSAEHLLCATYYTRWRSHALYFTFSPGLKLFLTVSIWFLTFLYSNSLLWDQLNWLHV